MYEINSNLFLFAKIYLFYREQAVFPYILKTICEVLKVPEGGGVGSAG